MEGLDQIVRCYSSKRRTNRWPFAFFMNLLDVAGIAAYLIYNKQNPTIYANTKHVESFWSDCTCFALIEINALSI